MKMNDPSKMTDRDLLITIATEIRLMRADYMKLFFALIGVIAASIGIKFMGSPPLSVISTYLAFLGAGFVFAYTAFYWRKLHIVSKLLRLGFVIYLLYSTVCRMFIFKASIEPAPWWYPIGVDTFLITLVILFILRIWVGKTFKQETEDSQA